MPNHKNNGVKLLHWMMRPTHIPAAMALVVILAAMGYAEIQNRQVHENALRAEVLNKVSLVRARIEGAVNANIQLVRGFVATIRTEPDLGQARFATLASQLLEGHSLVRHVAAAPDFVISMIYPLEGNEQALGIDYRQIPDQFESALRVRDQRDLVLAGPVELVQGGQALIGRFPVFVPDGEGERFWGIVSAVIDVDRLYAETGLLDRASGLSIAVAGRDALGSRGQHFFGEPAVFSNEPVTAAVILPTGSWLIAATPADGWDVAPPNRWQLRAWMLLAAALIMVPAVVTGNLMEERKRTYAQMRERKTELEALSRRLRLALDTSRVAIWETRIGDEQEIWDARMNALYGLPADGRPRCYEDWRSRVHPDDLEQAEADYERAVAERTAYTSRFRIVLDGTIRHIRAMGRAYPDADGIVRVVGVNWDVTEDVRLTDELTQANAALEARNAELELARRRIEHTALHDSLTGLPNRRYLDEVLSAHVERFAATGERAALLHIDLDRFKQINDTLGHAAGDAMLVRTSEVLKSAISSGDFVARVGGDEFILICQRPAGHPDLEPERLARLADRIISAMQQPTWHEGHECRCGVSIGIAGDSDAIADPASLLVHADIALYRAKNRGRNRYQFFNEPLQAEIVRTKRVADEILSGIEQRQFLAHYQPQFDARTLEVVGVEALVRWQHPTEGLLPPSYFLKIADELNTVGTIDRMVLEQTLQDLEGWKKAGIDIPRIAVNVSARRLHEDTLIASLRAMEIEPGRMSFELVESIFLDENDDLTTWNVEQIKGLGIDVEIDDFGTGHASIVSLLKLKPARLKIDRQFVRPVRRSQAQRQLVGSIVEIGRSLGIEVLAEGVETMEHARILRDLGCHALQGFAFARPMSAEALAEFVRSRRWRAAS